jgi:hypothetical protein
MYYVFSYVHTFSLFILCCKSVRGDLIVHFLHYPKNSASVLCSWLLVDLRFPIPVQLINEASSSLFVRKSLSTAVFF